MLTTCTNTEGGFSCGTCPPEYTGSGTTGCVAKPCSGAPTTECACLKVTVDGDDAVALANHGRSPFGTVQAAIDFAATDPHGITNVCVAGGANCPTDPLAGPTLFVGPEAGDLVMRDGIGVYGSYAASDWSRCERITTEVDPGGARGVYFGPEISHTTRFDGLAVGRAAYPTSAGVTVDGATHVELERFSIRDSAALVAATDNQLLVGVDLHGGAAALLTNGSTPYLSSVSDPHAEATTEIGVRSSDSTVELRSCSIRMLTDRAVGYGVLLEDSPGSSIHDSTVSLDAVIFSPVPVPNDIVLTGVLASGAGPIVLENSTIQALYEPPVSGAPNFAGIELANGVDAVVTGSHVAAQHGTGLLSRNSRVSMSNSTVSASYDDTYGAWLENSPGSTLDGVSARGQRAVGVHVTGDASGTIISNVGIAGGIGIELTDCGGAEPLIQGAIQAPPGSAADDTQGADAVYVTSDCHPRVENTVIKLSTRSSLVTGDFEAIRCNAGSVPSRCVVKNADISISYENHGPIGAANVAGVNCRGGSCAEVSSVRVSLRELSDCHQSCYRAGFAVIYSGASTLISNVAVGGTCGTGTSGSCWDLLAPTLYSP